MRENVVKVVPVVFKPLRRHRKPTVQRLPTRGAASAPRNTYRTAVAYAGRGVSTPKHLPRSGCLRGARRRHPETPTAQRLPTRGAASAPRNTYRAAVAYVGRGVSTPRHLPRSGCLRVARRQHLETPTAQRLPTRGAASAPRNTYRAAVALRKPHVAYRVAVAYVGYIVNTPESLPRRGYTPPAEN